MEKLKYSIKKNKFTQYLSMNPALQRIIKGKLQHKEGNPITKEHKCQPWLLYPAKLSITIEGETKIFHEKNRFTQYLSMNIALQRIIKGKLQ